LLTDGRWRETAVSICQTQPSEAVAVLVKEAELLLEEAVMAVPGGVEDPDSIIADTSKSRQPAHRFQWPPNALHILGIIESGCRRRDVELGQSLRHNAAALLVTAAQRGLIVDRKWAIEVAGTADEKVLVWLLQEAFRSNSAWLKNAAYQQIGHLSHLPPEIVGEVRRTIIAMSATGMLRKQRSAVNAQLQRLEGHKRFLAVKRLLSAIPVIDLILHCGLLLALYMAMRNSEAASASAFSAVILLAALSAAWYYSLPLAAPFTRSDSSAQLPPNVRILNWAFYQSSSEMTTTSDKVWRLVWGLLLLMPRILFIFAIAAFSYSLPRPAFGALMVASLYVATWSIGALTAALTGKYVEVWWWPFSQLALISMLKQAVTETSGEMSGGWAESRFSLVCGLSLSGAGRLWNAGCTLANSAAYCISGCT
jgi:hypothetical protein